MKHLYFVRHGQSQAQVDGVWGGQIETPLSAEGRQQVAKLGEEIKQAGLHFDVIICSPLSRTRHTAEAIAKAIGYPLDQIQTHELLIERSFGILDGQANEHEFRKTHNREDLDSVEGAETIEDLQKRSNKGYAYLQSLPYDTILVVGHGTHGRALRRSTQNKPHHHEYIAYERIPNATLLKLL